MIERRVFVVIELLVLPDVSNMIQTKKHMQIVFIYLFFLHFVKRTNKDLKLKKKKEFSIHYFWDQDL